MNTKKIIAYLSKTRWCDFKENIEKDEIKNLQLTALPFDNNQKAFVVGTVNFTDDRPQKFFSMPLSIKKEAPEDDRNFISDDKGNYYTDALLEPDFWSSFTKLLKEHNGKITFPNGFTLESATIGKDDMFLELPSETSKPLGVEQSNTTLKVGNSKVAFKLERMLDFSDGINSEFEMNEKLMREQGSFMPKTYGGLIWRNKEGLEASGGIVQEFVKNKGDMWNYLQNILQQRLEENFKRGTTLTPSANQDIITLVTTLSKRTQEMKETLGKEDSAPEFSPEKVSPSFLRQYEKNLSVLLYQTKNVIKENVHKLPSDIAHKAEYILNNWEPLTSSFVEAQISAIKTEQDQGTLHRVHGDYHLGQVMVTPDDDIKIIDFGGEPALPMSERKQKYISVRDIAGMYRSIKGYLGAVAVEEFASRAPTEEIKQERKIWGKKAISPLINNISATFLGSQKLSDPWLSLEILRKNLYEVKYEVSERPSMAYVPVQGLSDLFASIPPQAINENTRPNAYGKAK